MVSLVVVQLGNETGSQKSFQFAQYFGALPSCRISASTEISLKGTIYI